MTTYTQQQFTVSTTDYGMRTLTAEASTLQLQQPSDGFTVHSERTGEDVRFRLHATKCDADGDVQLWEFRPENADYHERLRAIVLND